MDTSSWETLPRTWTETGSTCSTKTPWASGCRADEEKETSIRAAEEAREPRRPRALAESRSCAAQISFMRDFADRLARTDPESYYDALVQFGNAPITAMVNLQWKREVLEKHVAAGAAERNRAEGNSELRPGQSTDSARSREPRPKGVRWKRPLPARRKKREEAEGAAGEAKRMKTRERPSGQTDPQTDVQKDDNCTPR
ncbi:hypothetical protein Q5P01_000317 [Channa striata]|uniref:Uncharacterized protein n=1 Tax=Channa striata TaxID=64152 RepID=A0AA88IZE1_CHASR|nr:hypothetical protein Q5P01_000317 [Channa striata]